MNYRVEQKQRIRSYLLRQMPAEERAEFEQQYAADTDLFDELIAVEDEMIGAYLRGEGSDDERQLFANHFLSTPAGRDRVEFAQSWMDYGSSRSAVGTQAKVPAPKSEMWPLAIKVAVAVVWLVGVVGGSWMAVINVQLRHQHAELQATQQELRRQQEQLNQQLKDSATRLEQAERELQQQLAQVQATNFGPPFVLSPGLARGVAQQKLMVIKAGASWFRLQINLPYDDYPSYNVSLETPEGTQIWHSDNLKSQIVQGRQPAILVNLPANDLASRTYVLRVTGKSANGKTSLVGDYSFHTIRQ